MASNNSSRAQTFTMVAVLLFVSYVMSCGPKYWRDRQTERQAKTERATIKSILNAGKLYTIEPYRNLWRSWRPTLASWQTAFSEKNKPGMRTSQVFSIKRLHH